MSTWRNVLAFADALIRLLLRLLQQRILSQVKTKGVPLPLPWALALAFEKVAPIILPSLNSGTPDFIRGSISCRSYFHLKKTIQLNKQDIFLGSYIFYCCICGLLVLIEHQLFFLGGDIFKAGKRSENCLQAEQGICNCS